MLNWLKGKKTYLTAFAGIIGGVVLCLEGNVVGGIAAILASVGLGSLRSAIANKG